MTDRLRDESLHADRVHFSHLPPTEPGSARCYGFADADGQVVQGAPDVYQPTLDDYRIFTTVVALGTMTAAADELGWTVQHVSKTIRKLEAKLGNMALLESRRRRLHPTTLGRELDAEARAALHHFERSVFARWYGSPDVGTRSETQAAGNENAGRL
jgi:hypothetical protein